MLRIVPPPPRDSCPQSDVSVSSTASLSTPSPVQQDSAASSVQPPLNYGNPAQQRLLRGAEQVVAPVDERAQRSLAWQGSARATDQRSKDAIEPMMDFLHRHGAQPRAASSMASGIPSSWRHTRGDGDRVLWRDREIRTLQASALDKQSYGFDEAT